MTDQTHGRTLSRRHGWHSRGAARPMLAIADDPTTRRMAEEQAAALKASRFWSEPAGRPESIGSRLWESLRSLYRRII